MKHRYLPMTTEDQKEMLDVIGVKSIDELFQDVPKNVLFTGRYKIKEAKSEPELLKELSQLAEQNAHAKKNTVFLGAGVYEHTIPTIVDHVISRSEFYTAYTPYQPEISQGELQAIFEFQTMICQLTGMDVANSSMYDGGTSLAEAAMLSHGHTRKNKILLSKTVHPEYRLVVKTYAKGLNLEVIEIPHDNGITSITALQELLDENVAAVLVQYPNFFGRIEPLLEISTSAHQKESLLVVSSNPLSLGVLKPPGELGADIVVGDAQVFGIPMAYGGPHCGYFAVKQELMRKLPGRLVGQTVDDQGRRGFVLTLQAREQHIRRDKATSNICSNQALNALAASVAMSAFGRKGIRELAVQNIQKANYAKEVAKSKGLTIVYEGPMFNEFIIKLSKPIKTINRQLLQKGIIGGFDLGKDDPNLENHMLIAVTELRTKEEIDSFLTELEGYHA